MNETEERGVVLNFLAGLGLGALLGAATALLLAPKTGAETREDLCHNAEELRAKTDKVVHDLSESGQELVKKSKDVIEGTKDRVQQTIDARKQSKEQPPAEGDDVVES